MNIDLRNLFPTQDPGDFLAVVRDDDNKLKVVPFPEFILKRATIKRSDEHEDACAITLGDGSRLHLRTREVEGLIGYLQTTSLRN